MNIYISGISGTGMGPLALMAKDAGHRVFGSDLANGPVAKELSRSDILYHIGPQDGSFLQEIYDRYGLDQFIYTSALPKNHPELQLARQLGLPIAKRDHLIANITSELNLKMVAVAGTHGKTTTTAMLIWAAQQLNLPASYLVGTTLPFAPSGKYTPGDIFFIYEADEYDRNFLHFHPWLSLITTVTYDHPDIYPTPKDYQSAFKTFEDQSKNIIRGGQIDSRLTLSGNLRREDATTALRALKLISDNLQLSLSETDIISTLNTFPGAGRRFERIAPGVYSDYAHHPEEISATIKMAKEEADHRGHKGVVTVYQPHQNTRQHQVRQGYKTAFDGVAKLFWLPTYLTREDTSLPIIAPADFITDLALPAENSPVDGAPLAEPAELDEALANRLRSALDDGYLVLLMTAGPADNWYRTIWK